MVKIIEHLIATVGGLKADTLTKQKRKEMNSKNEGLAKRDDDLPRSDGGFSGE
jgi:hypothetical protein